MDRTGGAGGSRGRLGSYGAIGLLTVAVVAGALLLRGVQRDVRESLDAELLAHAEASADFTRVAVEELGRRQAIAARNGMTGEPANADLTAIADTLGVGFALVLGQDGELLAVHPERELDGPALVAQFPHLQQALAGRVGVSATLEAPSFPSGVAIAVAAPFEDDDGNRRVLSTAFDRDATVLGGQLRNVGLTENSNAWLVDENGGVVAVGRSDLAPPTVQEEGISAQETPAGDVVLATAPVDDTPWRVVVQAPADEMYAPVRGWNLWQPWLLLAIAWGAAAELFALSGRNRRVSLELQRTNAELEATADRMRDFVAVASHELRTPAGVILGFAKLIQRSYDNLPETDRHRVRERLVNASERLATLTDELMTQATADRGALSLQLEAVDLEAAIADAIATSPVAQLPHAVECPPLHVTADAHHLHRILTNLLENAAKYGAPPIRVRASAVGDVAEIRVIDDGPGVPDDFREAMFERFARAESVRRQASIEGTGLGLSVSRGVAEAMHGSLDHEATEEGATFVLRLPVVGVVTPSPQ